MPILDPFNDPLLKRLNLFEGVQSSLPDPLAAQESFSKLQRDATRIGWAETQAKNWAIGSQIQAGDVLASVGAPQGSKLYGGLISLVKIDNPAADLMEHLEESLIRPLLTFTFEEIIEIILDVLEDVFSPLIQTIGAIPVYGWIIEAIWDVAMGIVKVVELVKAQRASDPKREYEAAGFYPQGDTDVAKSFILERMRTTVDWTKIFMPPGIGRNTTYGEKFSSAKLKGNMGRRIKTRGEKEGWVGYIPGTGMIDQGWEIGPRGDAIRNLGTLLPTGRDMAGLCWSQVSGSNSSFQKGKISFKNGVTYGAYCGKKCGRDASPSMFTVNAEVALRTWQGYLFDLRMWLKEGNTGMGKATRKVFVDGVGRDLYGWAKWDTSFNDKKEFDNFGINQSHPVKALRKLRQRQKAFLNRIDVAYVGPDYGVLKGSYSDDIKKRWDDNRRLLLKHAARCDVDPSTIPDVEYRLAMETALETCVPTRIGTLIARPSSKTLIPGAGEPPPPGAPIITTSIPAVRRTVRDEAAKRKKGKKGNLMLIGLGVGLLALAARKGK
jgi:hypothetical protein